MKATATTGSTPRGRVEAAGGSSRVVWISSFGGAGDLLTLGVAGGDPAAGVGVHGAWRVNRYGLAGLGFVRSFCSRRAAESGAHAP